MSMNEIKRIPCPCCGKTLVEEHEICEVCFWQNDPVQLWKPNFSGGANQMSLNQAKQAYKEGKPVI